MKIEKVASKLGCINLDYHCEKLILFLVQSTQLLCALSVKLDLAANGCEKEKELR